jgi:signal transduction histidine kinase
VFIVSEEPESLVLHILREMRAEMATKNDVADLRSEMRSLRADVASDLATLDAKVDRTRKDLSDQIVGLRRAVVEYHTSAIGHGVLISELEARLRRVEQRLDLQPDTP